MSRYRWQRALALPCLLVLGAESVACDSSNGVPQILDAAGPPADDASPIDANACACPGTELLSRQHLVDQWNFANPGTASIHSTDCTLDTDLAIGGACLLSDLGENSALSGSARGGNNILGFATWRCQHSPFFFGGIDLAARCVRPLDRTGEIAEGCACPPFETPKDRIFYVAQAASVPDGVIVEVTSSCPAEAVLIGGACRIDSGGRLIGHGSYPVDPQTWHCSWSGFNGTGEGEVAAICLNPPAPDAVTGEPVAPEVFEYVFAEDTLPANGTRIVDATCAAGDTLITGGCQVEDLAGPQMKRIGMIKPENNRPDTWQCAWRNPTAATPKIFAMAICLKPAATAAAE